MVYNPSNSHQQAQHTRTNPHQPVHINTLPAQQQGEISPEKPLDMIVAVTVIRMTQGPVSAARRLHLLHHGRSNLRTTRLQSAVKNATERGDRRQRLVHEMMMGCEKGIEVAIGMCLV
jgi:hypothetical protein